MICFAFVKDLQNDKDYKALADLELLQRFEKTLLRDCKKVLRKCANHITFFKSYVIFSKIHRLTFIHPKFIDNFPVICCE